MQKLQVPTHRPHRTFRSRRASQASRPFARSCELKQQQTSLRASKPNGREAYLSALEDQISQLRSRIEDIELQEGVKGGKSLEGTIYRPANMASAHPYQTMQPKKSKVGRIYTRLNTPSSNGSKGQSAHPLRSAFEGQFNFRENIFDPKKQIGVENNPQDRKPYRVKQVKQPIFIENEKEHASKDGINGHRANTQQQSMKTQTKQVKKVCAFVRIPLQEWQIRSIEDDFTAKMTKKLQIPPNFPIEPPHIDQQLSDLHAQALKLYKSLNIQIDPSELRVRKFKNGVFYNLSNDRHLIRYINGNIYIGEWQIDLPIEGEKNGFGLEYIKDKYIYMGEFKNGMREGKGTIKVEGKSNMWYDGEWLKGKPHGRGCYLDERGTKYIGDFVAGQKTGHATILNTKGLLYQGQVMKGLKHGFGKQLQPNGDQYIGQFYDGKFNGNGVYRWHNGSVYQGGFVDGKIQGKGIWHDASGDNFEGVYTNDMKNGYGIYRWMNGEQYEGDFKNDYRNGQGIYRYPDGKIGKFYWIDGKINHRLYCKQQEKYRLRRDKKSNIKQTVYNHPALREVQQDQC